MNLRFLKLPMDDGSLSAPFSLSLAGDHEMTLSPCRRVTLYEEDAISLETAGCRVAVRGKGLTLTSYREGEICIRGVILTLSVERSQ
ncbi:MAG: YabP/YqfC family sporulation protein [Clostridia bacterium]|nr:YabP/YqfC family sporulation protein [Clostridia bacterium]